MAGDPNNVRLWEQGDVYVFDPAVPYVEATHSPADIDTPLHAAWLPAGLMLGDPGVGMPRDIEKTDINAWQAKRFRTKYKNGKQDAAFTLLEDNEVTQDLIDEEGVPTAKRRRILVEFIEENGLIKRMESTGLFDLWVTNNDHKEDVDGRPVEVSTYPNASNKIWTVTKGVPA